MLYLILSVFILTFSVGLSGAFLIASVSSVITVIALIFWDLPVI